MRIFVTGATGFVGRAVVKQALAEKHHVTALVRDVEKAKAVLPQHANLSFVAGDIRDFNPAGQIHDRVIHLAWAEVGKYTDPNNLILNLVPQFEFLTKLAATGMNDITVGGTCFEYGMAEGICHEDAATRPVNYYGLAKTTLQQMLAMVPNLRLKWARFFYVYGLGQRPQSLLSQLLTAIEKGDETFNMSKGDQQRDFIHIDTLAHNLLKISEQSDVTGVINIGNGKGVTVIDFVEKIRALKNSKINFNRGFYPYSPIEPFSFYADVAKLKSIPGVRFDSQITL